jgi:hypothetical protein
MCRIPGIKCHKGTPETSKALTARNLRAWRHYRECRAVGAFPDDPIVRRNAEIILAVQEGFEREERHEQQAGMTALLTAVLRAVRIR